MVRLLVHAAVAYSVVVTHKAHSTGCREQPVRPASPSPSACLDNKFHPKFHYAKKKRFLVTSKYRYMHGVLNIDKIKN
jgi:hypothetical protein